MDAITFHNNCLPVEPSHPLCAKDEFEESDRVRLLLGQVQIKASWNANSRYEVVIHKLLKSNQKRCLCHFSLS